MFPNSFLMKWKTPKMAGHHCIFLQQEDEEQMECLYGIKCVHSFGVKLRAIDSQDRVINYVNY